jgi:lipoprotein-releasing system ATP-binding protein
MDIKVVNLSKDYKKSNQSVVKVLKNVNLEIKSGERMALMGISGAGKSTLLHILGLMDRPTSGKVFMDGKDFFSLNDKALCEERKKNVGFIFQFHYLLQDFTVLENILISIWDDRKNKIKKAKNILKNVRLENRAEHYPSELSGGEQQRAALARALINDPKIIFADEPTGNLDKKTGFEVEQLLFDSAKENNATLLVVTHSEELASKADKIIKINDGSLI